MMLLVFLNNKLITCDTIVPLVWEVMTRRPGGKAVFVVTDRRTYEAINANIVLRDAIREMGELLYLGRKRPGLVAGVLHRLAVLPRLAHWLVLAWLGRATFLHFKALNQWPLKFLGLLAPSRTVFAQGTPFGESELELEVASVIKPRSRPLPAVTGQTILRFRDDWPIHRDPRNANRKHFKLDPPFANREWLDHLGAVSDRYLSAALAEAKLDPASEIVACPLGWIADQDVFRGEGTLWKLLEEIMDIVGETLPELPLVIKPHPASIDQAKEIEALLATRPKVKGIVTHLHPLVLASRARCAVSFAHTTTFGSMKAVGVPTIEYTDYSDRVLEITGGGSYRPDMVDHFINHDPRALRRILRSLPPRTTIAYPDTNSAPLPEPVVDLLGGLPGGSLAKRTFTSLERRAQ